MIQPDFYLPYREMGEVWTRRPEAIPVQTVYHYTKSNIDGSRAGRFSLYVAAEDRIESFKWTPGMRVGSLVVAEMDWTTHSVADFHTYRVTEERRALAATLTTRPDRTVEVTLSGSPSASVEITRWPWHSYDFDFASLSFFWQHRVDLESDLEVGISDFIRGPDGMAFGEKGIVTITFVERDEVGGTSCRRYRIDGPGLENRGGTICMAADGGHLVELRIDLPDEPGYDDNWIRLDGVEKTDEDGWNDFLTSRLRPSS